MTVFPLLLSLCTDCGSSGCYEWDRKRRVTTRGRLLRQHTSCRFDLLVLASLMRDEVIVRRRLGVSGQRHRLNARDSVDTPNVKPIKQVLSVKLNGQIRMEVDSVGGRFGLFFFSPYKLFCSRNSRNKETTTHWWLRWSQVVGNIITLAWPCRDDRFASLRAGIRPFIYFFSPCHLGRTDTKGIKLSKMNS